MSLMSRLESFSNALVESGIPTYHYFAPSGTQKPYIVWNEDSEDNSFYADNGKVRQALSGYVEYFTKTEFDQNVDIIQSVLESTVLWTLESIIYGDPASEDNNTIHYTWSWRMR